MRRNLMVVALMATIGLLLGVASQALAINGVCSQCHTMHNSQNNASEAQVLNAAGDGMTSDDSPNGALLKNDCLGCHTGTNDGSGKPFVYTYGTDVDYGDNGTTNGANTLAGGNFYWADQDDAKGHNVDQLPQLSSDGTLTTPPGWDGSAAWTGTFTCGGTAGCHGDRTKSDSYTAVSGSHHKNDKSGTVLAATEVENSYRFLKGITGIEDDDYEYQPTPLLHNDYAGVARSSEADEDSKTISSLCAQCHGAFHNDAGTGSNLGIDADDTSFGSAWMRHPTDIDMQPLAASGNDYDGYGTTYQIDAPVGRSSAMLAAIATTPATSGVTMTTAGDSIVTCISCHRAHGTPNDDILRWAYNMDASNDSTDGTGCFICHTTKD